ncbi:uncharacterized protein TNCV_3851491 [Trichonephila clavipes]|nr:uncharacterized protein TNCV_3851491 [Trichonephila clavipes]
MCLIQVAMETETSFTSSPHHLTFSQSPVEDNMTVNSQNRVALGSLVVRASEWDRCPMPINTLRVHTEYVLVKSVGPEVLGDESRVQGTGEYFPPLHFHAKIMQVEIGGVAIYRPFGEFRRANSFCHLYGAQGLGQRQAYF